MYSRWHVTQLGGGTPLFFFEKLIFFAFFGHPQVTNRKWAGPFFSTRGLRVTTFMGIPKIMGVACRGTPLRDYENSKFCSFSNIYCDKSAKLISLQKNYVVELGTLFRPTKFQRFLTCRLAGIKFQTWCFVPKKFSIKNRQSPVEN